MSDAHGDPTGIDGLISILMHYGPIPALAAILTTIWRGSAKVQEIEQTQADHAEKLKEHMAEIAALKAADASARVIVAGLPTKEDLRAQTEQLQGQMQNGFDNLIRMISRRD